MADEVTLRIDGREVKTRAGKTVIQAAMDAGIYVPYLCYWPGMRPYGACRMCVVEVEGTRGTPASCTLPVSNGMVVKTDTPPIQQLRRNILELLLSEHPHGCLTCHRIELCGPTDICLRHVGVTDRCVVCPKNERCELKDTVRYVDVSMELPFTYNYRSTEIHVRDPFYDRDYNLCIVCARCTRVCDEVRGDDAIAVVERAGKVLVGTTFGTSLLESGCEFCGACIDVCPVGALVERDYKWEKAARVIKSICPHCPVGCQVKLEVDGRGRIIRSVGDWTTPASRGQLCFKGKFGMDFVNHRRRVTHPLIREVEDFVESTWEQALSYLAGKLKGYKNGTFALLVSPRATNEDLYLAQKFARVVMGTNSVDTSTNLRPELTAPLKESLGFMATTNPTWDLEQARVALVVNSNLTEEHNVAAVPLKKAHKNGQKLLVVDPREVELTRYADVWLRPRPGTEAVLLRGLLRVVVEEGLENRDFVDERCQGMEELKESLLRGLDLAEVEEVTGVHRDLIVKAAQLFAGSRPSAILYALDNVPIEQRVEVVRVLTDLALLTGNLGVAGGGLFPLRPGANEQGAYDVGCAPFLLPGQAGLEEEDARRRVREAWGQPVPAEEGVGAREVFAAVQEGRIKAMLIIGDSPTFDEEALHTLGRLEFLAVQESFLSPLAQRAHVVLPLAPFTEVEGTVTNLERRVQLVRQVVEPRREARAPWWALCQLAQRMGAEGFQYREPADVFTEVTRLVHLYGGLSYQRLEAGGLHWPCPSQDHPGTPVLYTEGFPQGKARLAALGSVSISPITPSEFPYLFVPGRVLHQPDRPMEVVSDEGLNSIKRDEVIELHPADAASQGIEEDDWLVVMTAGGERLRGRARLNGAHRGVLSAATLFGALMVQLETSREPDVMLRVPGLDIVPARLERLR
ncbi:MAG: molybdopterin-dependent oxidoreductase [Chloroflexi bacterium]|nr:molybdopterin-dependent oxidoreductase [Chloroflexota bacterium]